MRNQTLEQLEFAQTLDKASTAVRRAARKAAHNRLKRTEGVPVTSQSTTPEPYDPYHRSDEQIANYQERAKSQFPDN